MRALLLGLEAALEEAGVALAAIGRVEAGDCRRRRAASGRSLISVFAVIASPSEMTGRRAAIGPSAGGSVQAVVLGLQFVLRFAVVRRS